MDDPDYYVVAFTHAEDDELAREDAERAKGAAGCFALLLALAVAAIIVIVLSA